MQDGMGAEKSTSGLFPAVLMLTLGLGALVAGTALSDGVAGQFVVVAPPGAGQAGAMALLSGTDGAMIAPGGFSNVIIAASDAPGFADALRQAGAWAVFPAPRFLGCSTEIETGIAG